MIRRSYFAMILSVLVSRSSAWRSQRASLGLVKHFSSLCLGSSAPVRSFPLLGSSRGFTGKSDESNDVRDSMNMDERISQAKNWVSYKLSDKESEEINRSLGIENEVLEALKHGERLDVKKRTKDPFSKIKGLDINADQAKVKGFLQVNPVICSGCGTAFQTKSPDSPGYLSKEMFIEHRRRSELLRAKQDAVKLLDMAGLELTDPQAGEVLRSGNVSEEVIQGVKALGERNRLAAQAEEQQRNNRDLPEHLRFDGPLDTADGAPLLRTRTVVYNEETSTYETHVPHLQEGLPEELLQPMSVEEVEAYNNRFARFGRKEKVRKHELRKLEKLAAAGSGAAASADSTAVDGVAIAATLAERSSKSSAVSGIDSQQQKEQGFQAELDRIVGTRNDIAGSGVAAATTTSTTEGATRTGDSNLSSTGSGRDHNNHNPMLDVILKAHLKQQEDEDRVCICQRCFRLQNYNQVEASLRPGWSANELLTPERFEKLLSGIKDTPSVVLCLVDIFDLRGSILRNLKGIVGNNPVVIAANKVDLLPPDVSMLRLTNWIHSEVKAVCGYYSPHEVGGAFKGAGAAAGGDEEGNGEGSTHLAAGGGGAAAAIDSDGDEEDAMFQKYLDIESFGTAEEKAEFRRAMSRSGSAKKVNMNDRGGSGSSSISSSGGSVVDTAAADWKVSAKLRKARRAEKEASTLRRTDVHLVSCQTGMGMDKLLADLMKKAAEHGKKIHVMGAANVGKSSFINRLLESAQGTGATVAGGKNRRARRAKAQAVAMRSGAKATVSNLPGTTLDFLKIQLPNGVTMVDTPGLLQVGQLTSKLNSEELRQVIPSKEVKPVTIRMQEGKCVLLGGLARVELLEGRPCFFTLFASSDIKLHPTDSTRAEQFIERHIGTLIGPPATIERYNEIGPYVSQDIEITGEGWKKSDYDIVIAGLGWVSVTGPGKFTVRVTTPQDTLVDLRPALLPYEAPLTTVSFTGGRLHRKGAVKRTVRKEGARSGTLGEEKRKFHEQKAGGGGRAGSKGRKPGTVSGKWKERKGYGSTGAAGGVRAGMMRGSGIASSTGTSASMDRGGFGSSSGGGDRGGSSGARGWSPSRSGSGSSTGTSFRGRSPSRGDRWEGRGSQQRSGSPPSARSGSTYPREDMSSRFRMGDF